MQIYLVGGAVRDNLLGVSVREHDWVVVGATEAQMLAQGYQKVGKDFPVFLHPETKEEYALARTERKVKSGYYGFECKFDPTVTLEEDLLRRDLTINAIAQAGDGKIVDPFGGVADLAAKKLRHVSPAFVEDPVRVLRIARFAARFAHLGFTIAIETLQLMQDIAKANELDALVPERVWKETEKALQEYTPRVFFESLRAGHALERIFPQLNKLWGVPQNVKYHPEIDTGEHVMLALGMACKLTADPVVRFAVLCHDLGKGETPIHELPSHKMHEERGLKPIRTWCKQYRVPLKYMELALLVSKWHLHVHKAFELRAKTIVDMLMRTDAYRRPQRFAELLLACEADARGRLGLQDTEYPQAEYLRQALNISQEVDAKQFMEQCIVGEELGKSITLARIKVVEQLKKDFNKKS